MTIESPHLDRALEATRVSIADTVHLLASKTEDPYTIVSGSDSLTFMQTLLTSDGFLLEYQEGSLTKHFRSVRSDFSPDEVIGVLTEYASGGSAWKVRFAFELVEIRPVSQRIGHLLGFYLGRLVRMFR